MGSKSGFPQQKYIPGSDAESDDIFTYPFTIEDETIDYIKEHGRIMFIIRGPPGTGKDSLSKMLTDRYTTCTVCSADAYFSDTFSSAKRNSESLKLSHEFCHKKVESACLRNKHPVIVKNTHMKKFELQRYLDFAADYNYTVIMAVTVRKFEVTPEILALSNTKGLSVEYFQKRLRQWEEVIPVLTGWFLNPDDSSYLLSELQRTLDSLLGDGKFCRILNVFEKAELLKHYKARKLIYCVAACGENNRCDKIRTHYLSDNVQKYYGQCFTVVIQGYLVTPASIMAVVYLSETMKNLHFIKRNKQGTIGDDSEEDLDSLLMSFSFLNLGGNLKKHCSTIDFDADFNASGRTSKREKCNESDVINISSCSFMHLAHTENNPNSPISSVELFFKLLGHAADENGIIGSDQFQELEEDVKFCRLSPNAWLIKPPFKLSFKTIYTGLYV